MHSLTILVHQLDQPSPISVPQWLATLPGLADGASPAVAGNIDPTPALCAAVPHIAAALVLHMDPSLCAQVLCNASPETWWRHSHDYGRQTVASSTNLLPLLAILTANKTCWMQRRLWLLLVFTGMLA
jgi:hypothetical protein